MSLHGERKWKASSARPRHKYSTLMTRILAILCCLTLLSAASVQDTHTGLSPEESDLFDQIMDYRKSKGLSAIPLSPSLNTVAQTHCRDLAENKPDLPIQCNAHSWSDKGEWSSCCYTLDHKAASCMWDKPRELTSYTGHGFEIAVGSSEPAFDDYIMTADIALQLWKSSTGHNNLIINEDIWKESEWKSIGIGIHKGFATVWFGKEEDPATKP